MLTASAKAETITAEGQARTVSLMAVIGGECPRVARINDHVVKQYLDFSIIIGRKMIGKEKFDRLSMREVSRRMNEFKATGAAAWCGYQRANMEKIGINAFID